MTTIITKNSSTASAAPVAGDLTKGELAVNVTDKKLYTKDNGGSVVKLVGSLGNQEANAVAVTGGAIDGTAIGGTTASTASFTTVSASGNVTLSGGTANGVLYLNGSKVATSGSALTFDGSSLAVTLGSTTTPAVRLYYNGSSQYGLHSMNANGDYVLESPALNGVTSGNLYLKGNAAMLFGVGGSEQMRLTSTGLGIGTSSPQGKLHVKTGTNQNLIISSQGGNLSFEVANDAYSANTAVRYYASAHTWYAGGNNMFLDSSGNLGLGVTPSAWNASAKVLETSSGGLYSFSNIDTEVFQNCYLGASNWTYKNTNYATRYSQYNGQHIFYTAPSGTAGNAITFTQAMTLDASGNLGIGSTSPTVISNYHSITMNGTTGSIIDMQSGGTTYGRIQTDTNYALALWTATASPMIFGTNYTERARIDSSGNLLVGTTSVTNSPDQGVQLANGSSIGGVFVGHVNGTATGNYYATFSYNAGIIGSITQSGTAAVLYNVTSDQRLKENIVDSPEFGSVIDSIKVRSYDWKADGNHQRAGFVAQELVTVAPEAVHQPADPEQMMAVDYSKLVPMLVKEIQSLRKRLADAGIA